MSVQDLLLALTLALEQAVVQGDALCFGLVLKTASPDLHVPGNFVAVDTLPDEAMLKSEAVRPLKLKAQEIALRRLGCREVSPKIVFHDGGCLRLCMERTA